MRCDQCKWWTQIGHINYDGCWVPSIDESGNTNGKCRINPPGAEGWPETSDYLFCRLYEDKVDPLADAMNRIHDLNKRSRRLYTKWRTKREKLVATNKAIRATGELFGISRKQEAIRILEIIQEKYRVAAKEMGAKK